MDYVKIIRDIREDRNLKQCDIAKVLGISQQQYSRIETGERELHIDQLIKLCAYYQLSADYILNINYNKN